MANTSRSSSRTTRQPMRKKTTETKPARRSGRTAPKRTTGKRKRPQAKSPIGAPLRSPVPLVSAGKRSTASLTIVDDWLQGPRVSYRETPNAGGVLTPQYLVFHYTAGSSAAASVGWLTNPQAKASAHLLVGRDGTITQLASFRTKTWHAGISHWNGLSGMNSHSIGIEMDNAGPLAVVGTTLQAWFGKAYPQSESIYATHKFESEPRWWHAYSADQISIAVELAVLLVHHYGLKEILGHEDIAPDRKRDPGPAFPLTHIQGLVAGRSEEESEWYRVTATRLNIRSGPGAEYETVASPLPHGTTLRLLEKRDRWAKVEVHPNDSSKEQDLEGWVCNRYIEAPV